MKAQHVELLANIAEYHMDMCLSENFAARNLLVTEFDEPEYSDEPLDYAHGSQEPDEVIMLFGLPVGYAS